MNGSMWQRQGGVRDPPTDIDILLSISNCEPSTEFTFQGLKLSQDLFAGNV